MAKAMNKASEVVIDGLAEIQAKEKELREKQKLLKEASKRREWEKRTKKRNPAYVMGSLRPATQEDSMARHGWVCEIKCDTCGTHRVINKQDAFQVRYCNECKSAARKERMKEKRLAKKLQGKSPEDIQKEIEKLNKQLEKIGGEG